MKSKIKTNGLLWNLAWYGPNMIKSNSAKGQSNESVQCVQKYVGWNAEMSIKRTNRGARDGS